MASQNPIHTLSTPRPVERPRAKPLATTARSVGYGRSRGLSDHSGRQGRIISITPSVAHRKTNRSTPIRRSHRCAAEGEGLGTEIIARVVVSKAESKAVVWAQDRVASPAQISNPLGAFYDFRA